MTTLLPVDLAARVDQRVALAVGGARGFQAVGVALGVLEAERVLADFGRRQKLIFGGVEQLLEALGRADPVVEVAARADAVILFPFLDEDHRPALGALVPEIFGALPLGQERNAAADPAQPTHAMILRSSMCKARGDVARSPAPGSARR